MKALTLFTLFISSVCFSQSTAKKDSIKLATKVSISEKTDQQQDPPLTIVEEMPQFPGGDNAMHTFINKNIKFPKSASKNNTYGNCYVTFVVEKDGTLSNIKILRGVTDCPDCDNAALEVMQKMPAWNPGKQNGKIVRVQYNLPIKFSKG